MANLIEDSGIETTPLDSNNLVGWVTIQGSETLSEEIVSPISGDRSGKITCPAGPTSSGHGVIWFTDEAGTGFDVEAGQVLRVAVNLRLTGIGSVVVVIDYVEWGSTVLATVAGPGDFVIDEETTIPTDRGDGQPATHAYPVIKATGSHTNLVILFDDVWFGEPAPANQYVDAFATNHFEFADGVSGGMLADEALTAMRRKSRPQWYP